MRKNRRIAALLTAGLLALTPCVSAGMSVFAEGETPSTYDITVNATKAADSAFAAYQIFTGKVEDGKLTEIQWGSGMPSDKSAFLTALQAEDAFKVGEGGANVFASLTASSTAEDYSKAIAKLGDKSESANALARILDDVVTSPITDTNSANNIIGGAASGYYLVKETSPAGEENPISLNLLKVIGKSEKIEAKEDLPTLTKEIVGPNVNGDKDANTASVGDVVEYKLDSTVPDMTGYNKYFFVVNDTMESGLTFNPDSVRVKIGTGDSYLPSTAYEVQTGDKAKVGETQYTFQIVLKNFIQYNTTEYIGKPIEITYNATVNNSATAGTSTESANENTVNLTYSNNPNVDSNGGTEGQPDGPDEPSGTDPKGKTPDDKTYTYLTNLEIVKVDKDNHETTLQGAKFELTGESLQAVYHEQGIFKKDSSADPAYYLLIDGTYSDTAPTTETASQYVDGMDAEKYALVTDSDTNYSTMNKVTAFGESGTDGKVTFGKLGVGTYTIVETKSPTGYNKLAEPITIQITATPSDEGCTWSYKKDNGTASNSNSFMIENSQGSTLPSTGGVGTKLFYLFGGMLAVGSGVVLVTKKRMSYEK